MDDTHSEVILCTSIDGPRPLRLGDRVGVQQEQEEDGKVAP
jgi:hypothetical protein